jgi:hypothetical protein
VSVLSPWLLRGCSRARTQQSAARQKRPTRRSMRGIRPGTRRPDRALAENLIRPGGSGCRVRRQPDQLVALRRSCLLRDDDRLCCFDWPIWL